MSLGSGLDCFRQGVRLAWARPLRRFVWLPMAASLVLVVVLLAAGYALVQQIIGWIAGLLPGWLDWSTRLLAPLFYAFGILLAGWLFGFLAVVSASPFLGRLSARTEEEALGTGPEYDEGLGRAVIGALVRERRKLAYHLPRLFGVAALGLVPVVNLAAPLLWFAFGAWMLAVQFVDFAAENRGLDFRQTIAVLRANRAAAFGFGALPALLLGVPFAALFVIPAATCGGALLWRRLAGPGSLPAAGAHPGSERSMPA